MKTRWSRILLALGLAAGMLALPARAEEPPPAPDIATGETAAPAAQSGLPAGGSFGVCIDGADLPDSEELFAQYLQQQLYPGSTPALLANWGGQAGVLTEKGQLVYQDLKAFVAQVAGGAVADTGEHRIPLEFSWSLAELGVTGMEDPDLPVAIEQAVDRELQMERVLDCLLVDCPAQMYWFDKTGQTLIGYTDVRQEGERIRASGINVILPVALGYRANELLVNTVDTGKTGAASAVLANARALADRCRDQPVAEQLQSYQEEICALVDYDHAADAFGTDYGDPWQLIYVFDGDPATNVVCEGYAKAFQYLCDLAGIDCYTVTGTLEGREHMWNLVPLDGQNYLVDVTNCDAGAIGAPRALFLAGGSGTVADGYTLQANDGPVVYRYDAGTRALYPESLLTLAGSPYGQPLPGEPQAIQGLPETVAYGDRFTLSVTGTDPVRWSATGAVQVDDRGQVTVTGTGAFTISAGQATVAGNAVPKPITPTVTVASGAVFTGTVREPAVRVQDGDTLLEEQDYTLTYRDNLHAGEASVTVRAAEGGRYAFGEIRRTFVIAPADYTYGVADQPVEIGGGQEDIRADPAGTGADGAPVPGTLTWYGDAARTRPLGAEYRFAGTPGTAVTLYWTFTPDPGQTDYTATPRQGAVVLTLQGEPAPEEDAGPQDQQTYKVQQAVIRQVPPALAALYQDTAALETALYRQAAEALPGLAAEDTCLRDVTLLYSGDGGGSWQTVSPENFPAAGITLTLPYPAGTNGTDYVFTVVHMITTGDRAGQMETPAAANTPEGVRFTVHSLSPILLGWQPAPAAPASGGTDGTKAEQPAPAATPRTEDTAYYPCTACGYHDWTATDQGYRCDHCGRLESVRQLAGYGNVKGVYEPGSAAGAAAPGADVIPRTGEQSDPALWALAAVVSLATLGILAWRTGKRAER